MQLGVMLSGIDLDDVARKAALAQTAGFGACQLTFRWDAMPGEVVFAEAACRRLGLEVAAFGVYVNLLRPDDGTFHGVSIVAARNVIEAMADTRCRRLVMYSGTYGRRPTDADPANWQPEARETIRTELLDLALRLRIHGALLCLEPHYAHVLRTPQEYLSFARAVEPDVLRVVLDVPNLVRPEQYDQLPELLPRIVETLAPLVGLIHFKDISRLPDGRITLPAPGQGRLDFARFIAAIRAHAIEAPAIIEHVDENSVSALRAAREFVERYL